MQDPEIEVSPSISIGRQHRMQLVRELCKENLT